jgi:hypothetical protein
MMGEVIMRAPSAGIRLSSADASIVKGMLARDDRQSDIASYFGVNGGRIAEISVGKKFASAPVAPASALPPPGPYIYGDLHRAMKQVLTSIQNDLAAGNAAAASATATATLKKL